MVYGLCVAQDLLPHLPDFTEIDLFKDEICVSLEECSAHIEHLRLDMVEMADSAEGIVKVNYTC